MVVVPYTNLRKETRQSLPSDARLVRMSSDEDYWRLLASLWGQEFCIVEHDIVVHAGVFSSFAQCDNGWCLFPYTGPGGVLLTKSLGCTRFRALCELDFSTPVRWDRLDAWLYDALRARGYTPCVHNPPVRHLHWE